MLIKKSQVPILIIAILLILFFSYFYISQRNYEFIIYVGTIVLFFLLILFTNKKVNYSNTSLWGLLIWAGLHMAGGSLKVAGNRLYELILINISSSYEIFRYDQFVHIIGFGVATLIMFEILKPSLKNLNSRISLGIIVIMAGLGVGALNEIVEFIVTVLVPQTGIGGYMNSMLDLVSDFIGAILAWVVIRVRS